MTDVLARLHAAPIRRVLGLGFSAGLGGLLIWLALVHPPPSLVGRLVLLVCGGLTLGLAETMRRATLGGIELTQHALSDAEGRILARLADIRSIDRGTFAFKPSGGFLLRLRTAGAPAWAPGLWWRLGRRVGVGGVTNANEAKYMAEVIAALLSEREAKR